MVLWRQSHPQPSQPLTTTNLVGVGGGCRVHFRVFSSIPGLYPLETSSTLSVWQPKCLQTFSKVPQGVKPPICQPMISRLLGRRHDVVLRCCKFQHYYFGFLYYFSFIYSTNSSFYLYYYLSFFLILLVHYFSPFSQALNLFHYSLYDSSIVWLFCHTYVLGTIASLSFPVFCFLF